MYIWCENSAVRVMTNTRPKRESEAFLSLHCGKNMHASGQILMRDYDEKCFDDVEVYDIEIRGGRGIDKSWITLYRQGYEVFNDGVPYPDRLIKDVKCTFKRQTTQGFWVSVFVPSDATPGEYSFELFCRTSSGDVAVPVFLKIYNVTVPETKNGAFDHEYFLMYENLERYGNIGKYSPEWWKLMKEYAIALKNLRVNHLSVSMPGLLHGEGTRRTGKLSWEFCFDRVNAFIEHYLKWGSFRRIVLMGPTSPLVGERTHAFDEDGNPHDLKTGTEESEAYLRAYFAAVRENFMKMGWYDMVITHVSDEPHETKNWKWVRNIMREVCPEMKTSEPMDTYEPSVELEGECDEFIPRLEVYEQGKDFYDKLSKNGTRLWCYSCCFPEEPWHLNKFLDLPHHYARLIHWVCYTNNITGFLHWGFNCWDAKNYGLCPDARFKGDGYIVYPDKENMSVIYSNRAIATWEGVEEYELLNIVAKVFPGQAKVIAKGIGRLFCEFNEDPVYLESARQKLLTLASYC